jgi:hypothetical protein
MLSAKICSLYPELAALPYHQQLQEFCTLETSRFQSVRIEWITWMADGSVGEEPKLIFTTPLLRAAHEERFRLWTQQRLTRKHRLGKAAAREEHCDFLFWFAYGQQRRIQYMEDQLSRPKR